jgi:hypothetical protein
VDPYAFVGDDGRQHTNLHLNLDAPDVRDHLARLRVALSNKGITLAFWDTGGTPDACRGYPWLWILAEWKAEGIAILAETSCDLAAWITGFWFEFPPTPGAKHVARAVCPLATLTTHHSPDVDPAWISDAHRNGLAPVLDIGQIDRIAPA